MLWLGGFASDMSGTKAEHLAEWAGAAGQDYLRFDYLGHGASSGAFAQGTITRWREDALAVLDELTRGPVVLVGSSMGGWIACLIAQARPERIKGLVLIAPAPDFTEKLIWPSLTPDQQRQIQTQGAWILPSAYEPPMEEPTSTTGLWVSSSSTARASSRQRLMVPWPKSPLEAP